MLENSNVSENKVSAVGMNSLSKQEAVLLSMFRTINAQQQKDVLRILEVFTQLLK